ncbi:serine protease 27-like, partial [Brachionus plicatilis]
ICQNGACVSSVLVESNECPFADEPVQNVFSSIRLPTAHVSCSEYFGYLNRAGISISSFCTSSYSYSCCRSCLPYKVSQCLDTNFYCPYYRRFCNFFTYSGDKIADICPLTCSNCPPVSCQTGQAICLNGGTCVVKSNSELSCQCPQGYTGPVCENKNPCTPNPCQNGASCQPAGETAYICQCPSFFIGDDCSILNITISTTSFPSSDPSTRPVSTPSTTRQSQSSTPTQTRFSSTSSSTQQASSSSIPSTSQSVQPIPGVTNIGRTCMFGQNFSFCDVCGRQFADANVKIVGGVDANRNSWPSIGLLVFDYTTTYNFQGTMYRISRQSYCGSTLIDRNTVLTAAHCYISSIFVQQIGVTINLEDDPNFPANAFKVYLGLHSIQGVFDGTADLTGVTVVPVTKFTMHENYNDDTFDNDIAVLKLEREVALNSGVQPACLPPNTDYQPNTNTRAWIAGWGTLSSGGQTPNILQNTFITYYHSGLECNNLGSLNFDKQICAGEIQGGRDTCQGDSGGPLYLFEDNTFVQAGITSFGVDCALAGYPGVYTRVAAYLDWILNNM